MDSQLMDQTDRRILRELQRDAALPQRELADRIGLSHNACWRRVRMLEKRGIIMGRTLRLDRAALGLDLVVFMLVRTRHHSEEWLTSFHRLIGTVPEVIDFYRIGGDWDYLLKVAAADMAAYDAIYRRIIARVEFETVTSLFSMEAIRENGPLPL